MRVQNEGQLSYFVLQGSVLLFDHASIHSPCTVQRSLQPKVKKTRVQEIHQVSTAYITVYAMRIMLYEETSTTLYFESGWSRLVNPFRLGCTLAPDVDRSSFQSSLSLLDGQATQAGLAAPKRP